MEKRLYQTLEDRGNPGEVNQKGPFPCNWPNTWLGDGYYYWDHFFSNAQWWGEHRYNGNCIICEAICDYSTDVCFDLVGTVEHLEQFKKSVDFLKDQKLIDDTTTVRRVLNYMRFKIKSLKCQAIRVYGVNSVSPVKYKVKNYSNRLFFENSNPPKKTYLDLTPAIQICVFDKKGMNLRDYKVVYPPKYTNNDTLI